MKKQIWLDFSAALVPYQLKFNFFPMSIKRYLLPPVFQALSRHIPELQLQFRTEHSSELYNCVEHREIDAAFVKRKMPVPNVEIESFYVDEMVLVRPLTPENIEAKIVHPQELRCEYELCINSKGWVSLTQYGMIGGGGLVVSCVLKLIVP
ncbi:LysR family transcriptional regulator substrate-binding protein [Sporomusa sp.]|uniref:LysR family transcriptional regulator substrate-binding protein n=1 Tax=Sporomusa sp. TaxID=2078658 RepID=UPI002C7ED100|nr:LysR family transcriptional regulator substrate-binding protein [Sporomusa sp.]HWR05600.1 LysR family transcriptional regulator substrate-binding protein [Sporomusa sp.]